MNTLQKEKRAGVTDQILHGDLTRLVDTLHILEHKMSEAVYDRDTNVIVILVLLDCESRCIKRAANLLSKNFLRSQRSPWQVCLESRTVCTWCSLDMCRS